MKKLILLSLVILFFVGCSNSIAKPVSDNNNATDSSIKDEDNVIQDQDNLKDSDVNKDASQDEDIISDDNEVPEQDSIVPDEDTEVPCKTNDDCKTSFFCKKDDGVCDNGLGICEKKPEACPESYAPVCGCNNKTYQNICYANSEGINAKSKGKCQADFSTISYHFRSEAPYPGGEPALLEGKVELRDPQEQNPIFGNIDFDNTDEFQDYRTAVVVVFNSMKNPNFFVLGQFEKVSSGSTINLEDPTSNNPRSVLIVCDTKDQNCENPLGFFKGTVLLKKYSRGGRPGSVKELELSGDKLEFETLVYNN